jgi:hypothetical protein
MDEKPAPPAAARPALLLPPGLAGRLPQPSTTELVSQILSALPNSDLLAQVELQPTFGAPQEKTHAMLKNGSPPPKAPFVTVELEKTAAETDKQIRAWETQLEPIKATLAKFNDLTWLKITSAVDEVSVFAGLHGLGRPKLAH